MRQMRARRAREIEAPGDAAPLRDAAGLMVPEVERTLDALRLGERDAGNAQLARRYAAAIDGAENPAAALARLGPPLARVLAELGRTARRRPERAGPSRLDELREARAAADRQRTGSLYHRATTFGRQNR
jgi:hypothetical protein